jgi:hypothetical protein
MVPLSSTQAATSQFHKAQSVPEKRLEEIIHQAENDGEMTGYLLKIPGFDPSDRGYSQLFTDALFSAWQDTQTKLLQQDCGGEYREDMVCGVDGNPVTCSQDISDTGYLYRTVQANADMALVSYSWPHQPDGTGIPTYRLVKEGSLWKLDGVDCGADLAFNMN